MYSILPRSLKGLLLLNDTAFLLLVLATAALSGLWAHFSTQSSREAVRINTLVQESERIRGDMYRQLHEVTHARLTENPGALRVYADYRSRIADHFAQLSALARDEGERGAIAYLHDTYGVVHQDMDKVFTDPNEISESARMKLLDPTYQEWMLVEFESALHVLDEIIEARRRRLEASRSLWLRWTPVVVPASIALAVALLLFSRRSLNRLFVMPLQTLVEGTVEISRRSLQHRITARGVEEIQLLVSTFNEVTRKLAQSQGTLIESERQAALGALVPVVAHNIRNPLASIRATAQMLDESTSVSEREDGRRAIIDTVDRLERWVTALLSYLHPLKPRRRQINLADVAEGALAPVEARLRRKQLDVVRDGWEGDHAVDVDADLLEQAIYALLSNAVEASPAGGVIRVSLHERDTAVELRIDDDGPGIGFEPNPDELLPGPTTKPYGTGLGIPIAYKICQAHGGKVVIEKRDKGGTRASITLPVTRPSADA
jgi:signal transduction histidine kinase